MHDVWDKFNSAFYTLRRYHISEVLIIFLLILVFNNFLGNPNKTIKSDGVGYYDYLVSVFIRHDIDRRSTTMAENPEVYDRLIELQNGNVAFGIYLPYGDKMVNKYSCGTALLISPFFLVTKAIEGSNVTGYEPPFQKSVLYAALFYLFLALVFFRFLLDTYDVKPGLIFICQFLMVLGTAVPHYVYFDASFSHIYSLAVLTAFAFVIRMHFQSSDWKYLYIAGALLGLIFILRQVNLLVVFFVPFLVGSWEDLKYQLTRILRRPKSILIGVGIFIAVASFQFVLWYLQTGDAVLYSYRQEAFNFADPQIFNSLFSYKKGLFLYYPILAVCVVSSIALFIRSEYYLLASWFGGFGVLVYVFSAWWSWDYGACFGQRPFIEYYPFFLVLFALGISQMSSLIASVFIVVGALCIPFTLVQIRQYQTYIFHWYKMDQEKYWKVFLKTDERYRYWVWQDNDDANELHLNHTVNLGDISSGTTKDPVIYRASLNALSEHGGITTIRVAFTYPFKKSDREKMVLSIVYENDECAYIHGAPVMQYCQGTFDRVSRGYFDYNIGYPDMNRSPMVELQIRLNDTETPIEFKDVNLELYRPK